MRCPGCRARLREFDTRCGECGYSLAELDDSGTGSGSSDGRPRDVVRAVKLLAGSVGFSAFAIVGHALEHGIGNGIFARATVANLILIAISSVFIFLIWMGTGWAKNVYLFLVACQAGNLIWTLMIAAAFNVAGGFLSTAFSGAEWISFALQCYVAYLLMQPDSAEWFR